MTLGVDADKTSAKQCLGIGKIHLATAATSTSDTERLIDSTGDKVATRASILEAATQDSVGAHHALPEDDQTSRLLQTAMSQPPIRLATLRELRPQALKKNLKLQHDLNYMSKVSFYKIAKSKSQAVRMEAAERYWQALDVELSSLRVQCPCFSYSRSWHKV